MKTSDRTDINFALDLNFSEILTNPILDIAARFWEKDRYEAFKICYRSMRALDDLVDNRKIEESPITTHEQAVMTGMIDDWVISTQKGKTTDPFQEQLLNTISKFVIPLWPWERLATAMKYDVKHDGFRSLRTFLRYSEGAAIGPASIFMHLCSVTTTDSNIRQPAFDIHQAARPLALFSYFVHILRDFQEDQLNRLNYFSDDLMLHFNVSRDDLRRVAQGGTINDQFRNLISRYHRYASIYRQRAKDQLTAIFPNLKPRYQLSLTIIYELYLQIFERINPRSGLFTAIETNPTPDEVHNRIDSTVNSFQSV